MHYFSGESLPSTNVVLEIPTTRSQKPICQLDFQHSLTRIPCIFAAPVPTLSSALMTFQEALMVKNPPASVEDLRDMGFNP